MRILSPGHAIFAATLIALGLYGLAGQDFNSLWAPAPKSWPIREAMADVMALVTVAGGVALFWRRTQVLAAAGLAVLQLVWTLAFEGQVVLRNLGNAGVWDGFGESILLILACWVLFIRSEDGSAEGRWSFVAGERGLRAARLVWGLVLIDFGIAHFGFLTFTASLVPDWLPDHVAWAEATGAAYVAAGLAILAGVLPRLAATLAAVQMAGFTLLVWGPRVLAGSLAAGQLKETVMSFTLTVAAWVVAETYAQAPWFAVRPRLAAA